MNENLLINKNKTKTVLKEDLVFSGRYKIKK